jgi:hypothetical protein
MFMVIRVMAEPPRLKELELELELELVGEERGLC